MLKKMGIWCLGWAGPNKTDYYCYSWAGPDRIELIILLLIFSLEINECWIPDLNVTHSRSLICTEMTLPDLVNYEEYIYHVGKGMVKSHFSPLLVHIPNPSQSTYHVIKDRFRVTRLRSNQVAPLIDPLIDPLLDGHLFSEGI